MTTAEREPVIASGLVGMLFFLGTEAMIFAGLISAFLILRAGASWPPAGEPRLPAAVTAVSTLLLILSGVAMARARTAIQGGDPRTLYHRLRATAILGALFLAIQGSEWWRLVHFGLTLTSSLYGAMFYTLVGVHGVHVAGGMAGLLFVLTRARAGRYSATKYSGVEICWLYWSFVVAVWPVLYVLVYLT